MYGFSKEEFARRRTQVADSIGKDAVAVIQGGPKSQRHEKFRQTNDFYYLCGVEVPHAYLLIDGRAGYSTLFLPYQSDERAQKEGRVLNAGAAAIAIDTSGVDSVAGVDELAGYLERARFIFTPMRPAEGPTMSWDTLRRSHQDRSADPWDGTLDRMRQFVALLRDRCPFAELRDLAPTLDSMRLVKSEAEIALLREAGRITAVATTEAIRSARVGAMEYELDAILRYGYLLSGARDVSYRAIIASGKNSWYGHYENNDDVMNDGELVLIDCAPDYHYYTSDIGRMFPVNGTFTRTQRQLYGFIVEYHKVFLELLGPGEDDERIRVEAANRMRRVVDSTNWEKPIYERAARRALEFPVHLSHPVGLAVHDVGHYRGGTLREGVVLSVDPQLIVPEERGYYRVEDTVVITSDGIENFTRGTPLELDEIERVMKSDGILQHFPASRLGEVPRE